MSYTPAKPTETEELRCVISDLCDQVRELDAEVDRLRGALATTDQLLRDIAVEPCQHEDRDTPACDPSDVEACWPCRARDVGASHG